ncbi:MAG: alpha/beta fold hydrolase [Myxococcales bacterium]|nr:alpha/beta fold hydrolase [Myxococcales bacterium]
MSAGVLFIHGAFHGDWCWEKVVPLLAAGGVTAECIDLHRGSREADIQATQAHVNRLHGAGHVVIPVGHSLGCFVVAALDPATVAHGVFLAGPLLGPGTPPIGEAILPAFGEAVSYHEDGTMTVSDEGAREIFYHDCAEADAHSAVSRLRPNVGYGGDPDAERPVWRVVPSTYLVCEDDRVLSPDYQRKLAALCTRSESFATGHSPMLCAPQALADALLRSAATLDA